MSDGTGPNAVYLLLCLLLIASSLIARRLPLGRTLRMAAAWIAIFSAAFAIFALRDDFSALGQRLKAELVGGAPAVAGEGGSIILKRRDDGHFYADAKINGEAATFLIDSGATKTTIDRTLADRAGITTDIRIDVVDTANGTVAMHKGIAERFEVGTIVRQDLPVSVSKQAGLDVVGMNFLSTLRGWRVQGDRLVLQP